MNTASNRGIEDSSPPGNQPLTDHEAGGLGTRKTQHLEICLHRDRYRVETGSTGLEGVSFLHRALPEIADHEIDTSTTFLGRPVRLPLFISSMTGGSEAGYRANKELARAAQAAGVPVGMGSIRILFRKPEVFDHFALKKIAPDVPVFANIGSVQLRDMNHAEIFEVLRRLEVEGIAVHLNPGQELFQSDGDRDFRGVLGAILRFVSHCPIPVIIKETGFGVDPRLVRSLLDAGATYLDLAGSGGTNWVQVEAYRAEAEERAAAEEFADWGYRTGVLLAAVGRLPQAEGRILASGGLRTGLDLAKSLALGAHAGGYALPLIRAIDEGGAEKAIELIARYEKVLRTVMMLTGSRSLAELRSVRLQRSAAFQEAVYALLTALEWDTGEFGGA